VHICGGVLADQVGYGKMAITLSLIDCTWQEVAHELGNVAEIPGKICVKASLMVVPPHLTCQWSMEIKKFVSPKAKVQVVTLISASNLNSLTVQQVIKADIIVVASNLFKSMVYLMNLEAIAAGSSLPALDSHYFNMCLDTALETLGEQVDQLCNKGSVSVMDSIHAAQKRGSSTPSTFLLAYLNIHR
jgi:SNF2 family DNA or RNA helicase